MCKRSAYIFSEKKIYALLKVSCNLYATKYLACSIEVDFNFVLTKPIVCTSLGSVVYTLSQISILMVKRSLYQIFHKMFSLLKIYCSLFIKVDYSCVIYGSERPSVYVFQIYSITWDCSGACKNIDYRKLVCCFWYHFLGNMTRVYLPEILF